MKEPEGQFAKDFDLVCGGLYSFGDLLKLLSAALFPGVNFQQKKKVQVLDPTTNKAIVLLLSRWAGGLSLSKDEYQALEQFAKMTGLKKELEPVWKKGGAKGRERKNKGGSAQEALGLVREVGVGFMDRAKYLVRVDQIVAALWLGTLEIVCETLVAEVARGACAPLFERDQVFIDTVVRLILESEDSAQRVKVLEFFLDVADTTLDTGNFHGAHLFHIAFNLPSMVRLKNLWQMVSSTQRRKKEELDALFSPRELYRTCVESMEQRLAPYLPPMKIVCERVRALYRPQVKGPDGTIVLEKLGALFQVCQQFLSQQGLLKKVIVPQSQEAHHLQLLFSRDLLPGTTPTLLHQRSCKLEKLKF